MTQYAIRRLLHMTLVMFIVSVIVFMIIHLIPGDPAAVIAGPDASQEVVENVKRKLGLDQSLPSQFSRFLGRLLRGDLGRSFYTNVPLSHEIFHSYPKTLTLASGAVAIALVLGIPLGVVSATRQNSLIDLGSMTFAMVGASLPNFWLGLTLVWVFAVQLGLLPSLGSDTPLHYILPCVTLSMNSLALVARQTRSAMVEVLAQDYVRTARAKGLSTWKVVYKHALRNGLIPVTTAVGVNFGFLLGGSVVTESVFSIRGLGLLIVDGILRRDYPVIQAGVLVLAFNFSLINLLVDLLYGSLDPRIRYQ